MSRQDGGRRGRAFWVELVGRWRESGESQRAVAEAAGVNVHTLQYWVAKLKAETEARSEVARFVEGVQASLVAVRSSLALSVPLCTFVPHPSPSAQPAQHGTDLKRRF